MGGSEQRHCELMASGPSFPIRLLDGPLLDEALAAGQGPDATLSCAPGMFVINLGGRVGRREVATASLHGVKKAGNKLKLLLTPSPGGPGHVIGLRRDAELVAATDSEFGTFRKAVVKTSKGPGGKASPGGASTPSASMPGASPIVAASGTVPATPVGEDVMATFRATSAASAKGRRLAASGVAAEGSSSRVAKKEVSAAAAGADAAAAAGSALAEHLGAATDLADAERGEAAIADGKLPEATVREQALRDDPALRSEHRSLVVKGAIVSEEEFWMGSDGRLQALRDAAARLRVRAYSRRRSAARTQRSIGMRVEVSVTPEMTQQLLATDSRLRAAYTEHVASGKVPVMDFWRRYFTHMARQRDRQALRLREDAIAGRSSSSSAAAAAAAASLHPAAVVGAARSAAAGGNATPLGASARGDDALFAGVGTVSAEDLALARTAAARRAALVDPRFSLAATAQDAQTGVLAAGPGDLIGADESAAASAQAAVSRAGRGTRAAQRLYEPDDVRIAHSSEAERVREREARAAAIAEECQRFADVALPAEAVQATAKRRRGAVGSDAGRTGKRGRGLEVNEEDAEGLPDLVATAPKRVRRLVLEGVHSAEPEANPSGEAAATTLARAKAGTVSDIALLLAGQPVCAPGADSATSEHPGCRLPEPARVALGAAARATTPNLLALAEAALARAAAFEAVQRNPSTGLPLAMQPAWADWARASARRGTEVLALLWRLMAKADSASGELRPADAAKVSDALRRVMERVGSLQSGTERLKGTPDEAVAGPVIEVLQAPLQEAEAAAKRLLGVARQ